ncbi:MAG: transglutaminase protein, partial [Bacilli bacterium]|nr:transglutaminase protein [Bacilli bacterium]
DHFLFESKQGYCDHFSTAMVILARSLGIPARWVKGYTAGAVQQTDQEQMLNDPNASTVAEGPGVYTILNSDAHSWVEVYFPGFGWIPFEPTSGFSLPKIVPDSQLVDLPAAAAPAAQTAQKSTVSIATQPLLAAVFLLLIALIVYSLVSRTSLFFNLSYFIQRRRAISRKQRVTLEFRKLVYSMRRKGMLYLAYETMRETFERWVVVRPTLEPHLSDLLSILEKAKYTQADITTAELSQVVELVKRVCNNHGGLGRK